MIDYRRAFKIACELLNGATLYGVDANKIFEIMMDKDGVITNDSYEKYILNHLQELDHGQYTIKALEQEPCDAVDREAVLDLCDSKDPDYKVIHFKEDVECLPPVIPQPKTAHWIAHSRGIWIEYYECSECGKICSTNFDYCPNCGAKMQEAQESEGE